MTVLPSLAPHFMKVYDLVEKLLTLIRRELVSCMISKVAKTLLTLIHYPTV